MTDRERIKPVQIRVTQQELDTLKAMARAEHRSVASFIVWYILYRTVPEDRTIRLSKGE